jgi:hypothetical protein
MPTTISLGADQINLLDVSSAIEAIDPLLRNLVRYEQQLQFQIDYPLDAGDPRELPEVPEIRLWFIRLDALYPYLPFFLDWKAGELARYTAMLVPHQFHPKEGIQFNPEALEIFVMHKLFAVANWLKQQNLESRSRGKAMAQMLGYELEEGFFDLLQ